MPSCMFRGPIPCPGFNPQGGPKTAEERALEETEWLVAEEPEGTRKKEDEGFAAVAFSINRDQSDCKVGEGATCDGILRGALKMAAVGKLSFKEKKPRPSTPTPGSLYT